jgi:5-methylcytosine-specific restriction endonuclease McrA
MPTIKRNADRPPWMGPKAKPFATSRKDIYNTTRWRRDSARHKALNPVCVNFDTCGGATYYSDHIISIQAGGDVWSWDNRQPLCKSCGDSKAGKEGNAAMQARRGKAPGGGPHL